MDGGFDDVRENVENYSSYGIPISPDIMYYISASESLKLLEILKKILINTLVA